MTLLPPNTIAKIKKPDPNAKLKAVLKEMVKVIDWNDKSGDYDWLDEINLQIDDL